MPSNLAFHSLATDSDLCFTSQKTNTQAREPVTTNNKTDSTSSDTWTMNSDFDYYQKNLTRNSGLLFLLSFYH